MLKYLLVIIPLVSFSQSASLINDFDNQQKYVKEVFEEIKLIRKNPCEQSKKYKVDLCDYFSRVIKIRLDKRLNRDCYEYAKQISSTGRLDHSHEDVPGNESLAKTHMGYKDVVFVLMNEIGWHDDGHIRHITGNTRTSFDDEIFGIGLYKVGQVTYCVIRSMNFYEPVPLNLAENNENEEEEN